MREILNYIIEGNIALLFFLAFYKLFLNKETNFRLLRCYLVGTIIISVTVPFIHLNETQSTTLPALGNVVPEYWLPEVALSENTDVVIHEQSKPHNGWQLAGWVYCTGALFFSLWLVMQLGYVWITMRNATTYKYKTFTIIESPDDKPTFSFFKLIYIGRVHELSATEKDQIIRHEMVHSSQWHSLDILLIALLGILFWFNPFIKTYKKILIQLHEFEADARAVEGSDVNAYCSLLARVALQAHFPIASHFNESLTVKRIEMMRTFKKRIQNWKLAAAATAFILCFLVIACQDQVLDEVAQSTISQTGDYPQEVKADMEKYLSSFPKAKLTYMEGDAAEVEKFTASEQVKSRVIGKYDLDKNGVEKKGVLLTDVVEYAEHLKTDDKVFMVVEKMPEYPGGYPGLKTFIQQNLKPTEQGKGVVYVSMVIGTDGTVSDVTVLKGISAALNAEAVRVVSALPKWTPGEQNGVKVKTRFTLPIRFGETNITKYDEVPNNNYKMGIQHAIKRAGNETIIQGIVTNESENGRNLQGVNVILVGTTVGTTTDANGNFTIKVEQNTGQLALSHIGFDTQVITF